jgi:hypothetical protein
MSLISCYYVLRYTSKEKSFPKIKTFMISLIGMAKWTSNSNEKSSIVRLIIDSTFVLPMIKSRSDLECLHRLSADMCYKLYMHMHRERGYYRRN